MKSDVVKLVVITDGRVRHVAMLRGHGKQVRVHVEPAQSFVLAKGESGAGPDQIRVHREGRDLFIRLGENAGDKPELVIVGCGGIPGADASIVGLADDGQYHAYGPAPAHAHSVRCSDAPGHGDTALWVLGDSAVEALAGIAAWGGAAAGAGLRSLAIIGAATRRDRMLSR